MIQEWIPMALNILCQAIIMFIMFCEFLMAEQIFLSPQVK